MNAWKVVAEFEERVADYAAAPYAVAVDSCTNALLLSLLLWRLKHGQTWVTVPNHTYVGVPYAVLNAGHKLRFQLCYWSGVYTLHPTNVVDAARRFHKGMYGEVYAGTMMCLSFHSGKVLPLENGGMILLDDWEDCQLLRMMRYDGRTEGVAPKDDTFMVPGYHCMMMPSVAARGVEIMPYVKAYNADLPWDDYPDLSKQEYFREVNCG